MNYIIRTCKGRESFVDYLMGELPDAKVSNDNDKGAMWNFLNALDMAGDDAAIHLEDDALLVSDFSTKAMAVINKRPDMVCQFFSMRKADVTEGSRIEAGSGFLAAVCFYLPPKMSRGLRLFFPKWERIKEHPTGLDLTIADFLKKTKQRYYIHCPNLADHRIGKSRIDPRRSSKRVSLTFEDNQ